MSPFHKILFKDFFITDILCSMLFTLTSLPLFFCVAVHQRDQCDTSTSPWTLLFSLLPHGLRFIQCLRRTWDSGHMHPHLTNGGKYAMSLMVMICSFMWRLSASDTWFGFWIFFSVLATASAILWDVRFLCIFL
jgi:hypothetical protein